MFTCIVISNNNFSCKNVLEIQTLVKDTFLVPAAAFIKSVCKKIEDVETKSNLQNFIDVFSNPFVHCNTDYMLNSWLKNNEYLEDPIQFTIDETIVPVMHNGEISYNEEETKGILLPLKFQFKKYFEKTNVLKNALDKIGKLKDNAGNFYSNYIDGRS